MEPAEDGNLMFRVVNTPHAIVVAVDNVGDTLLGIVRNGSGIVEPCGRQGLVTVSRRRPARAIAHHGRHHRVKTRHQVITVSVVLSLIG